MPEYQRVILLEACRVKDRLDAIEVGLDGKHSLLRSRVSPNQTALLRFV